MSRVPFRAFLAAGKWAFITYLIYASFTSIFMDKAHYQFVGLLGRNEFEVLLFRLQSSLFVSLAIFFMGNIYGMILWVITLLFFRKPVSTHYIRNITLLCGISTFIPASLLSISDLDAFSWGVWSGIIISLWTAFLGNRFAVNYLRSQQKTKNAA